MKILIIRTAGNVINFSNYNLQEVGLAKAFIKLGHQADIVYFGGKNKNIQEIKCDGGIINLFWLKGISIVGNGIFKGLKPLLDEYDVIQVNDYDQLTSIYLMLFSKYRDKVVLYHGPYINKYTNKYRYKCKVIDKITFFSKRKKNVCCFVKSELAKQFLEKRGFNNITVTGVGLDTSRLNNKKASNDIENIENLKNEFVLLFVGRIDKYKNLLFALKVLNEVRSEIQNVHLLIVGYGDDEYEEKVKEYIQCNNLKNNITWISKLPQEKMRQVYDVSNVLLLPTLREIFGMVILESMYCNIPVITTYNGGSCTAIDNEKSGYILPLDVDKWEQTIIELYNNPQKMDLIQNNANFKVKSVFTWDNIAKTMIDKYRTDLKKI